MNRPSQLPIILTILLNSSIYCQDKDWWTFELDGIGVDFPFEEVSQKDTTILGIKIKMLYAQYDNKSLIFQKQLVGKNISEFPHNHEALRKYHDEVVDGMQNRFESEVIKKEINIRGFIGTNATFVRDSVPFSESNIFLIENHLIIASYHSMMEPFDGEVKEEFLYSLNFGDIEPSSQMIGESKAYRQGVLLGKLVFYGFLGIGAFFVIRSLRKK